MEMITKKTWNEFINTGLLLFINQILHVFGWAIVVEVENERVVDVYPARVKYRGFMDEDVKKSYKRITDYIQENINELSKDIEL